MVLPKVTLGHIRENSAKVRHLVIAHIRTSYVTACDCLVLRLLIGRYCHLLLSDTLPFLC